MCSENIQPLVMRRAFNVFIVDLMHSSASDSIPLITGLPSDVADEYFIDAVHRVRMKAFKSIEAHPKYNNNDDDDDDDTPKNAKVHDAPSYFIFVFYHISNPIFSCIDSFAFGWPNFARSFFYGWREQSNNCETSQEWRGNKSFKMSLNNVTVSVLFIVK